MPRLKSRHEFPPYGWKFYQPQTRWELPGNLSFNGAVLAIIEHRRYNAPFLKQLKLPMSYEAVGDELDSFNATRCINAGHLHFVSDCSQDEHSMADTKSWVADEVSVNSKRTDSGMIMVVLPFCGKDLDLMLKQVGWMGELGGARGHNALVAFDHATSPTDAARVADMAKMVFKSVSIYNYQNPPSQHVTLASKFAFNLIAGFMETTIKTPWIWWEADMTALKPGFMDTIQQAYERSGKAFFGPIVPAMGHMNGTAVYPPNTYSMCPSLRRDSNDAFDTGMRPEMEMHMADASPLIYHVWCVSGGRFQPYGEGSVPANITAQMMTQVPQSAVAFHRCKDDSIIRVLRAKRK